MNVEKLRGLHDFDLKTRKEPEAVRMVDARRRCAGLVQEALGLMGEVPQGTSGWHLLAFAIPAGEGWRLGLVDIAKGLAVDTGLALLAEWVDACTVPAQREGPQASGAAAWTVPDAGEARKASAPAGWVQLLVDARLGYGPGWAIHPVYEADSWSPRIVARGLRTCYGRPGAAGTKWGTHETVPATEWPGGPEGWRARARVIAVAALERWADRIAAETPGCLSVTGDASPPSARRLGSIHARENRGSMCLAHTSQDACGQKILRGALADAGVTAVCRDIGEFALNSVVGGRHLDRIQTVLGLAVEARLAPVVAALATASGDEGYLTSCLERPDVTALATAMAARLLRGVARETSEIRAAIEAEYLAAGPVTMNEAVVVR